MTQAGPDGHVAADVAGQLDDPEGVLTGEGLEMAKRAVPAAVVDEDDLRAPVRERPPEGLRDPLIRLDDAPPFVVHGNDHGQSLGLLAAAGFQRPYLILGGNFVPRRGVPPGSGR